MSVGNIYNSKPEGNSFFHIAYDEQGVVRDMINAVCPFNIDLFTALLRAEEIGCKTFRIEEGYWHITLFNGDKKRPVTEFMLMKYQFTEQKIILLDVAQTDLQYLPKIIQDLREIR